METFFQQSLIYRGKSSEKSGTPYPGTTFSHFTRNNYCGLTGIANEIIAVKTFPLRLLAGKRLVCNDGRCFIAGQCTIKFSGYQGSTRFTGMNAIDIVIGMRFQHCIKVNYRQVALLCNAAYHGYDAICYHTIINAKIGIDCGYRQAKIYLGF